MTAFALRVEYDGGAFVGWQRQANGLSVQQVLEEAASRLAHGAPITAAVAGRTDAGVHAAGQVAMIDLPGDLAPERVREALNFHMKPHRVAIVDAALAPEGWHPRFAATARHYRYRILRRRARPALLDGHVWHVPGRCDPALMAEGAKLLLGRHDFSTFRAAACQAASPVKTLDRLDVTTDSDLIELRASARSFLHHQVRNMVGTLKLVGEGAWSLDRLAAAFAARDRRQGGPTAPPDGLTLMSVDFGLDPFTPVSPSAPTA